MRELMAHSEKLLNAIGLSVSNAVLILRKRWN